MLQSDDSLQLYIFLIEINDWETCLFDIFNDLLGQHHIYIPEETAQKARSDFRL